MSSLDSELGGFELKHLHTLARVFLAGIILFFYLTEQVLAAGSGASTEVGRVGGPGADTPIWQRSERRWIGVRQMLEAIEDKALIFVGEVHSNPNHHLVQLYLIGLMKERYGPLNVALEALPFKEQEQVDLFTQQRLQEGEFLANIRWDKVWGYPYELYRPILDLVRLKGGKLLAIGPDQNLIRAVGRSGFARSGVLQEKKVTIGPPAYEEAVRKIFEGLPAHRSIGEFQNFFEAQCLRDELMAQHLRDHLMKDLKRTLVISGNQHILNYWGIPSRFLKAFGLPITTLLLYSNKDPKAVEEIQNDFVWVTQ